MLQNVFSENVVSEVQILEILREEYPTVNVFNLTFY